MKLVHLDLFSGIGGASYALDQVYGKENIEHTFCEIDPFCQAVLQKHWPEAKIYGDIRTLTKNSLRDAGGQEKKSKVRGEWNFGARNGNGVYLLTGGFPCQPFSQAGRRKGTEDDRHLWPEMFRVIREFRPRWVVGENVAGLLTIEQGMVFKQVLADLESEGYEVQSFVIPAVAVNAPHRRDRVWIVANRPGKRPYIGERDRKERHILQNHNGDATQDNTERSGWKRGAWEVGTDAPNPRQQRGGESNGEGMEADTPKRTTSPTDAERRGEDDTDPKREGLEGGKRARKHPEFNRGQSTDWSQNWLEVATGLCGVDDGLPARMDGTTISASRHRKERLKGLGNAWVPQVAMEIFRGIKEIEL